MYAEVKGIIVAATRSGSGKTIAALALMKFFRERGLEVAPFKTGPDFIDTSHYELVCGSKGRNLDTFMMTEEFLNYNLCKAMVGKDVAVIEGVMGLFDGYGDDAKGSTAELARKLNLPILLLVDAKGMSQSIVPLIHGFLNWDKSVSIIGVLLNRVNSEKQYNFLKSRIEKLGVKCFGYIPSIPELVVPERHLGIYMGHEQDKSFEEGLKKATAHLEGDRLLNLVENSGRRFNAALQIVAPTERKIKVAVAKDNAFSFLYEENLELFRMNGAYIHFFSPLKDENFGEADLLYLPGGYPELYIKELSRNDAMKEAILDYVERGGFLYAECGGLIYLAKEVITNEGRYRGANILPFTIEMGKGYSALGYVDVLVEKGNPLFPQGTKLKGHRFHYSYIKAKDYEPLLTYRLQRKGAEEKEGYVYKNLLASYVHVHFGSNPNIVAKVIEKITESSSCRNLTLI